MRKAEIKVKSKETVCPICKKVYKYPPGFEKKTCGVFDCVYKMALKELRIKENKERG